jgi:hypothetical protein
MDITVNAGDRVAIQYPPLAYPTTFVIAAPERPGQLYVTSCKIGNEDVLIGDEDDLFTFIKHLRVPAGLPVSVRVRSNWDKPLTVNAHLAKAGAQGRVHA